LAKQNSTKSLSSRRMWKVRRAPRHRDAAVPNNCYCESHQSSIM
jgi:hypothetical protein